MKNIFTLLLGGLLTTSAFANDITLTLPNNSNYQVMIDGRNVSGYNYSNNTIYLNNLQYGQHSIEVYRMKKNGKKNNLTYSSSFNSSPQYDLNITVENNGRVQMYQTRSNDYGRNGRGYNGHGNNRGGYGNNDRWGKHKHHDDGDDDDDDDRDYRNNNGGYNHGGYDNGDWNNNRYNQAMSDNDFNQLVQKIRNQWIGKMSTARDAVNNNYFNTYQVRQILQIFSSESDRLELAKLSYRNVVDQQNFRQLYDLFSYQSQTELDRYTRDFRY
jgi:hypothetical protein